MNVAETPCGEVSSLETELERLIDRGLDTIEPGACSPLARSRSPRTRSPKRARCMLGRPLKTERLLLEFQEHHLEAKTRLEQTLALRDQKEEELRRTQSRGKETSLALTHLTNELASSDNLVKKVGVQHSWLANILGNCEKAQANRMFDGEVADAFNMAVTKLREVRHLQNVQLQEAYVLQRQASTAREASSKEVSGIEASLEETRALLARIDEDARTFESNIHGYARQLHHLQAAAHMEQSLSHLHTEIENAEEVHREARLKRDEAKKNIEDYSSWSKDLELFFRGHGARDATSIVRGLQTVFPSDPLPTIIRTMLIETRLDMSSPTVVSMFNLVSERLKDVQSCLHNRFLEADAAYQAANHHVLESSRMLREREEQVSIRLAQATCNLVATPVKNCFRSQAVANSCADGSLGAIVKDDSMQCNPVKPSTAPKLRRPSISSVLNGTSAALRPSRS